MAGGVVRGIAEQDGGYGPHGETAGLQYGHGDAVANPSVDNLRLDRNHVQWKRLWTRHAGEIDADSHQTHTPLQPARDPRLKRFAVLAAWIDCYLRSGERPVGTECVISG